MASPVPADLTSRHEENVRPWLDLIDSMRAQGVHEDLPLPQVPCAGRLVCVLPKLVAPTSSPDHPCFWTSESVHLLDPTLTTHLPTHSPTHALRHPLTQSPTTIH